MKSSRAMSFCGAEGKILDSPGPRNALPELSVRASEPCDAESERASAAYVLPGVGDERVVALVEPRLYHEHAQGGYLGQPARDGQSWAMDVHQRVATGVPAALRTAWPGAHDDKVVRMIRDAGARGSDGQRGGCRGQHTAQERRTHDGRRESVVITGPARD